MWEGSFVFAAFTALLKYCDVDLNAGVPFDTPYFSFQQPEADQNGGGDAPEVNGGEKAKEATNGNGTEATNGNGTEGKEEDTKEDVKEEVKEEKKVKKKISFRSFSFLRREKKQKEVKNKNAKNDDVSTTTN